jgi:hypothetical protein
MTEDYTIYRRIHILGAPGSGKTTLARQLAAALAAPHHDLDPVAYEGGTARKRTLEERQASLKEIIAQSTWITEGSFLWWIDDLLYAADAVIWLDLPWYVSLPRILTRHVRLNLAGTNPHPGVRKLLVFFWHCRKYYLPSTARPPVAPDDDGALHRKWTLQYLAPFMTKVVHCRYPAEVDRFIEHVHTKAVSKAT